MVRNLTLAEIKEQALETYGSEWAFGNFTDESGRYICRSDEDDEYYTDGERFLSVDDVDGYIEPRDAWIWCTETGDVDDIVDSFRADFKNAVKMAESFELTQDEIFNAYKKNAIENADLFLEWLWEREDDKN